MIHTATLTIKPSRAVFDIFTGHPKSYFIKQDSIWMNKSFKDYGLILTGKVYYYDGFAIRSIQCRINFKRLIEQQNRIAVYTDADFDKMVATFNTIMVHLGGLPCFAEWNVKRIDYCINIKTPYVKEYISLMQKGDIPVWQRPPYNPTSKRYCNRIGSVYLPAKGRNVKQNKTGSITINFYDKNHQQAAETIKNNTVSEALQQSENILRLEVQCHRPKLSSLARKYSLDDTKIINFLSSQISFDVLETAIKSVCRLGDYQRKTVAEQMLEASKGLHKSTKEDLKTLLQEVNRQHQSVSKARDRLAAAGILTRDRFNQLLKKLDELNINPVTIPDNKSIPNKTHKEGLENIYIQFFDTFNQFN